MILYNKIVQPCPHFSLVILQIKTPHALCCEGVEVRYFDFNEVCNGNLSSWIPEICLGQDVRNLLAKTCHRSSHQILP